MVLGGVDFPGFEGGDGGVGGVNVLGKGGSGGDSDDPVEVGFRWASAVEAVGGGHLAPPCFAGVGKGPYVL